MFDDLVYDFVVFNKGNNSHSSPAFGTDEGINLIASLPQTHSSERSARLNLKNIRSILALASNSFFQIFCLFAKRVFDCTEVLVC